MENVKKIDTENGKIFVEVDSLITTISVVEEFGDEYVRDKKIAEAKIKTGEDLLGLVKIVAENRERYFSKRYEEADEISRIRTELHKVWEEIRQNVERAIDLQKEYDRLDF